MVGLGNPGADYDGTRHNVGYEVAQQVAAHAGISMKRHRRAMALAGAGRLAGHHVVVAKPLTFMNHSGSAVAGLAAYYGISAGNIVVAHDELDLPLGGLRLKCGGGDGGHNGLKSIRASMKTGEFIRVRVGIGRPPGRMDPAAYVLRRFSAGERSDVDVVVGEAADAITDVVVEGLSPAQNRFNR